jgi:hypothetical protein
VIFGLNVTVGTYNIFEVRAVKQWMNRCLPTNREGDPSDFNWQIAGNFDPKYLPADIKKSAISHLGNDINSIANYLESYIKHPESNHWIQALDQIDQRRGTQWKQQLTIGNYYG